jgi:micrococcal nuclease
MQQEAISAILALLFVLAGANTFLGQEKTSSYRVTEVVDGDTVDVIRIGEADTVRVLGIDTPEKYGEVHPREFGLENSSQSRNCLRTVAENASNLVQNRISGREISVVQDPRSDERGDYGRLLAYIEYNNTDIGEVLLEKGYARVYDSSFERKGEYRAIESESIRQNRGIWSESCGAEN